MGTPQSVLDHYLTQQRLKLATVGAVRSQWARMGDNFDGSWQQIERRVLLLITAGQLGSARNGIAYVGRTLDELGAPNDPAGRVMPTAFVGIASDGRDLDTLAQHAVVYAKQAVGEGATSPEALAKAGNWLSSMVGTQMSDAARGAAGVSVTTRPTIGYTRMLSPPSCSRCAVLAGAYYRWNAGFERHLNCDCVHIPCTEDRSHDLRTDPTAYFRSLDAAEQSRLFTNAGAAAIRDGADVTKVVNARLPTAAGGMRGGRAMPEHLYAKAAGNRDEAVRLLTKFGYIT